MADANATRRPRWWPKRLMWFGIIFLILLVVLYLVATSAVFFKSVVLPRIGKSMNSTITVGQASISPFSKVVLKDLKVTPNGKETLLTAQEVRARYSLFKIIGGTMKVDEVAIVAPVVQIVEAADGSSNLDPIMQSQKEEETKKKKEEGDAPRVDLKKFGLVNATVQQVKHHANGQRDTTEISKLNMTLEDLRNGSTAKLAMGADISMANNPPGGASGTMAGKLDGNWTIAFSPELKPTTVQGGGQFNVENSTGSLGELSGLSAQLITEVTPTEIKEVALQFKKGNRALGEVRAQGPLDINKMEGQVNVLVLSIDKQVLNLAGAASGMDFGSTMINSTNQIQLANAGQAITAQGQVGIAKLSIKRDAQSTPPMDVQLAYHVAVNNANEVADLRAFTLNGVQGGRTVLKGDLTSPMRISWGGDTATAGDSTFRLVVDSLNLADWKAVAGDIAGKVNMTLNLQSQQSGKQLGLDVTSQIDGLAMAVGSNRVQNVAASLRARGQAIDMKKISLPELRVETTHAGQPMLTMAGNVQTDLDAKTTEAQFKLDGALPAVLKALSRSDANATSGALNGQLQVKQKGEDQSVNGKIAIVSFTGQYGEQKFNNFGLSTDLDGQKKGVEMEIKSAGTLTGAGKPGGNFDVSGKFDSEKQTGQFDLKLANVNENAVRPFLEPMFPGKQLVSISINGNASGRKTSADDARVKADFKVANLAVRDPGGAGSASPPAPLEAGFKLEATQKNKIAELENCELTLSPTPRAKNVVKVTGHLDQTLTNAMQGSLKVTAETLDVTPFYNLVAGDNAPEPAPPPGTISSPSPAPADANKEPKPIKLPFRNTVADVQIGRLFLREVDIANFKSTTKVDGSLVSLKPLAMSLNGAPVNASVALDLGVAGYKYDLAFNANRVPVEPLANSFSPEYKGQAKGELLADVNIKGAGTTGVSLQKTLTGKTSLVFTNASIQLGSKWRPVFLVIGTVLRVGDLTKSPINWLAADTTMGDGKININRLIAVSDAFIAESQGVIPIADVLTNSVLRLPLELSLRRSIAERANLVSANAPTNSNYVQLPTFARVTGTIGAPKADTDEKVILGILARSAAGIPGVVGGDAGKVLQGIGGFLTGDRNTNRAGANTNAAPTNTSKPRSLLDLLPKPKK